MFFPIQDIQSLVFNEYINLDHAMKILKNWDDIISKFPKDRKSVSKRNKKNLTHLLV